MTDMQRGSQSEPHDVDMRDRLEDTIRDLGQEYFQQAHVPMYDTLESDSKKPLYLRCKKSLTLLLAVSESRKCTYMAIANASATYAIL